jgi:hypothetical protein
VGDDGHSTDSPTLTAPLLAQYVYACYLGLGNMTVRLTSPSDKTYPVSPDLPYPVSLLTKKGIRHTGGVDLETTVTTTGKIIKIKATPELIAQFKHADAFVFKITDFNYCLNWN